MYSATITKAFPSAATRDVPIFRERKMHFEGKLKSGGVEIQHLFIFKSWEFFVHPNLFGLKFSSIAKERFILKLT